MALFRRKRRTDYSYYSSYSSKNRRKRLGKKVLLVALGAFLVIGLVVYLNFNRIRFLMKGYSWSTTSEIVSQFDNGEENEILKHEKMDHILEWIETSNKVELYDDYERYYKLSKDLGYDYDYGDVIEFIDDVFVGRLRVLITQYDYSHDVIWELLEHGSGESDFNYLLDNKLNYNDIKDFMKVDGYRVSKMGDYIAQYQVCQDYNYTVNIVNYPFIITENGKPATNYEITNPDDVLTLVKDGFFLSSEYEPDDLIEPDSQYVAPDCENRTIRKPAYDAMMEMIEAAEKEDLHLILNSGYRSYEQQTKIYNETEERYGGAYAAEYVATPGASEHQTGLGLDMTSQSVVDGKRLVFSDTDEYKWVKEHCYDYGFIIRFEEGTDNITGISHEPWHLRYVGVDVAQEIHKNGWTFEEYCLYKNVIPDLKRMS